MKTTPLTATAITVIMIIAAACGSSKKTAAPAASAPASSVPLVRAKPADGIYVPGEDELAAILGQYPDATLAQLKEGYTLYADSECIGCHGAKNIYQYGVAEWKHIMDDMAPKARISDSQKDAVYKYVLAIKAAKAKS